MRWMCSVTDRRVWMIPAERKMRSNAFSDAILQITVLTAKPKCRFFE